MARKIYITGGKGGAGATTVAVGLGLALSSAGEKTLLIDGDALSASAMIVAGLGNMQVYTLSDYEKGACRAKQAAISHPKSKNFYVMPSLGLTDTSLAASAAKEIEGLFDFILCDKTAFDFCEEGIIVTEPYFPSIKAADGMRSRLLDGGMKNVGLIANKVNGGQILSGEIYPPEKIAEILRLELLAVIPEDPTLPIGRWRNRTMNALNCAAASVAGKSGEQFDVTRGYFGLNGIIKRKMRAKI